MTQPFLRRDWIWWATDEGVRDIRLSNETARNEAPLKLRYNVRQAVSVYNALCYFLLSIALLTRSLKSQAQETVNHETTTQRSAMLTASIKQSTVSYCFRFLKDQSDCWRKQVMWQVKLAFVVAVVVDFCQNILSQIIVTVPPFHRITPFICLWTLM